VPHWHRFETEVGHKTHKPALRQVLCLCASRSDVLRARKTARQGRAAKIVTTIFERLTAHDFLWYTISMAQEIPGTHVVGDFGQKALIVKDGKVLMCKGIGDTHWDFPGGRLHVNEDPSEGLMRELKEELGVDTKIGEPFYATVWYGAKSGLPRIFVVYLVDMVESNAAIVIPPDELEAFTWIGQEDLDQVSPDWLPVLRKFF
jgi:8-oxo-dGTP pyrophosphatase MutT (NUDIX family)